MKVLMSIKPQYANKIFSGEKKFEFRRAIWKNKEVKSVIVYSSSPEQKVIGEFEISEIISTDLQTLLEKTGRNNQTGDSLREYYKGKDICHAIGVKSYKRYSPSKTLADFGVKTAPQSFVYIK